MIFKFDTDNIFKLIRELARGVQILHSQGIWHRDIKPQNVIICNDSGIKIIDFNISKKGITKTKDKRWDEEITTKFYSKFFTQVSSPAYAAPEILTQGWYNESIDIWGIGIIIYWMLFGFDNFQTSTADFEWIKTIQDPNLMNILLTCVDKNPELRPNIDELVEMLS